MPLFVTVTPGTTITSSTTLDPATLNLLGTPAIDVVGTVDGGSLSLSAGSVNTTELAAKAVTFAKMQDVGTNILLGNDGSGTAIEQITPNTTNFEFGSGTFALKNRGVSEAKLFEVTTKKLLGRNATTNGDVQQISLASSLSLSDAGVLSVAKPVVGFWQDGTPQTIPASGATLTREHGLGYAPNIIDAFLFCDDAGGSNGYSSGDFVHHSLFQLVTGSEARQAFYLFLDVSNVNNILCKRGASLSGSSETGIAMPNKTTGVFSSPMTAAELAKWKIVLKAIRFN